MVRDKLDRQLNVVCRPAVVLCLFGCVFWNVFWSASSRAQELESTSLGGDAFSGEAPLADTDRLEWTPWAAAVPIIGLTLGIELGLQPHEARWRTTGPIDDSFDSWVRETPSGRRRARHASDGLLYTLMAAPVVDIALWQSTGEQDGHDVYRLISAAALSFSISSLLVVTTKNTARRARPYDAPCREDPESRGACNSSSRYRGFISGHAATAFTGASLLCAFQRLRGQSGVGRAECLTGLLLASLTAALRVVGEQHYVSDVVVGSFVGFLSGFIVPVFAYPRQL